VHKNDRMVASVGFDSLRSFFRYSTPRKQGQMTSIKVSFNFSIDNDDYKFETKEEAIKIAKSLTSNKVGAFDWSDEGEYKWLSCKEYVVTDIEEDGSPLYMHLEGIEPGVSGAIFSHVSRVR
jgi:hypothetical protein